MGRKETDIKDASFVPAPVALPASWRWVVAVRVPFDWGWSKNRMWAARSGTHARRLTDPARARRSLLALHLKRELSRVRANPGASGEVARKRLGKDGSGHAIWFGIHVRLPDRKGDALNALDLVADAIQDATGIDDRHYQLAGLTWEISPETRKEPSMLVWVGEGA